MAPPLPLAAAASRLAGLLDPPAAPPRTDPVPLGMRAFLAALAPYAATSRIYVLDAAAASRAAAACRASLVGDQTASSSLLNAAAALGESFTHTLDAAASVPKSGSGALGDPAPSAMGRLLPPHASYAVGFLIDAAASASARTLDESSPSTPKSGTGARGDPAPSGIGRLAPALAPCAAASKRFMVDAAAATSHILNTAIGAAASIEAPRRLFSTATSCVDQYMTTARHLLSTAAGCFNPCAVLVVLDAASASQLDSALAAPYSSTTAGLHLARTGMSTRHLFTSAVGHRLPMTTASPHQFFLTRALSTANNDVMRSKAGARVARQRLKLVTKMRRRSPGFKSLESQLRMSHLVTFSKKNMGQFFLLFTLFTITSQGMGEVCMRVGQVSDVLGGIDGKLLMGHMSDVLGGIQLVGIIGEDYGWVEV